MSANTLHRRQFLLTSLAFCATLPSLARAAKLFETDGIAVNGTDVVAYFTQGAAIAGSNAFATEWNGAKWLFSSEENRAAFEADPKSYAPQYGGYCAYAAAQGALAPSVPEAWTIHKGKLYLNFSLDVRKRWLQDPDGYIAKAEAFWAKA